MVRAVGDVLADALMWPGGVVVLLVFGQDGSQIRLAEIHGQIAGLLDGPLTGRVGGDTAEVHPAGAVLDEHQDIQPAEQHGVNMDEINGEDPGGLRVEELPPGRADPPRRGIDSRGPQDLIHGGRRDRYPQLGQLAVYPPVAPERVLLRQADSEPRDAAGRRRAFTRTGVLPRRTVSRARSGARDTGVQLAFSNDVCSWS
jgi:hypothetical protein